MKARKRTQPATGSTGILHWPNGEKEQVEFVRMSTSVEGMVYVKREQQRNQLENVGPMIRIRVEAVDWLPGKKQ